MTYDQILSLLERGMMPADILALNAAPDPAPDTDPDPAPATDPDTVPAWAVELNNSIKLMTNAMHANAIMRQQQPAPDQLTAAQALANIVDPPKTGKK